MSTISLPRARKDQRKHEPASVIFYIKNSCYPFKMMGCLRLQTSCPADPSHRRGFRNKIAMKIRLMSKSFQTTLIPLLGGISRMKNTAYWTSNTHLSPLTMGLWIKRLTVNNNVIYIVMSCLKSSSLLLNLPLQLLIQSHGFLRGWMPYNSRFAFILFLVGLFQMFKIGACAARWNWVSSINQLLYSLLHPC